MSLSETCISNSSFDVGKSDVDCKPGRPIPTRLRIRMILKEFLSAKLFELIYQKKNFFFLDRISLNFQATIIVP